MLLPNIIHAVLFVVVYTCNINLGSASPTPMWPSSCQNVISEFNTPPSGGQYEAIGCTFRAFISITTTSSLSSSATATLTVSQGQVNPGSSNGIEIAGPSASNALTMGTLHITVRNVIFGQDSVLRFTGSLPPSSSLTFANNNFFLTRTNGNSGATYAGILHIAAIAIVGDSASFRWQLSNGASLLVTNNTLSATHSGSSSAIMVITVFVHFKEIVLKNRSSIYLCRNNLIHTNSSSTAVVIHFFTENAKATTMNDHSFFVINDNSMSNATISGNAYILCWSTFGGVSLANNSTFSLSANAIYNIKVENVYVLRWLPSSNNIPINVAEGSSVSMNANSIRNVHSHVLTVVGLATNDVLSVGLTKESSLSVSNNVVHSMKLGLQGAVVVDWYSRSSMTIDIAHNSTFLVNGNGVINTTANASEIAVILWRTEANGKIFIKLADENSHMAMDGNGISQSVFQEACCIYWHTYTGISLEISNRASISIDNNFIENATIIMSAMILYWSSEGTSMHYISDAALFSMRGNTIARTAVATNGKVNVVYWEISDLDVSVDRWSRLLVQISIVNTQVREGGGGMVVGIYWPSLRSLAIAINSAFIIFDSRIADVVAAEVYLSCITAGLSGDVSDNSNVSIRNNMIRNVSYTNTLSLFHWSSEISLGGLSSFSITQNSVIGTRGWIESVANYHAIAVVYLSTVTFVGSSAGVVVSGNNFTLTASASNTLCAPVVLSISTVTGADANDCSLSVVYNQIRYQQGPLVLASSCPFLSLGYLADVANIAITDNTIESTNRISPTIQATNDVRLPAYGTIVISRNKVQIHNAPSTTAYLFGGPGSYLRFGTASVLRIDYNVVTSSSIPTPNYLLVNVTSVSNLSSAFVSICGNEVFGDTSSSDSSGSYLSPNNLKYLVRECPQRTLSTSKSITADIKASTIRTHSYSSPLARSVSITKGLVTSTTLEPTLSQSWSFTPSAKSLSLSFSLSRTSTQSITQSRSQSPSDSIPSSPSSLGTSSSSLFTTPSKLFTLSATTSYFSPNQSTTKSLFHTSGSVALSTSSHTILLRLEQEYINILLAPLPAPLTQGITITASAVGGVVAAVDAQTVAIIGLVACARADKDEESNADRRALSVASLDGTCEGVLLGNTIAVVAVGFATAVTVGAARIVLVRRSKGSRAEKVASLANTCAMVRAPHVWLMVCLYLTNSFAVCGLELARGGGDQTSARRVVGAAAFGFSLALAASFPIIALLLGTRRLLPVRYCWEPRAARVVGRIVFQAWAHDPSLRGHQVFGCVLGANRRLGCLWALLPHSSFLAGLPLVVASGSGCVPLFALSSALYFALAVLVLVARPRRVVVADMLHGATLAVNGVIVSIATSLLHHPYPANSSARTLEWLGQTVTVLVVVRSVHSMSGLVLALLLRRGSVGGVEVGPKEGSLEYSGLWWPLEEEEPINGLHLDSTEEMILLKVADVAPPLLMPSSPAMDLFSHSNPTQREIYQAPPPPRVTENSPEGEEDGEERYLTDEQVFRREIARDCVRRQLEEFLTM